MYFFPNAFSLVKKYEPYYNQAEPDPTTGSYPYTIGYGLNYYPDGTQVKAGQKISKKKAEDFLKQQLQTIAAWIDESELHINEDQREALISFVHSVGIDVFEDSLMHALIADGKLLQAAEEFTRWIYDEAGMASPLLIERRRSEKILYLSDLVEWDDFHSPLLLQCFTNYQGSMQQDMAINYLEQKLDPYLLAEFFNIYQQQLLIPSGTKVVGV